MRVDAERNRRRILEAASELFAQKGLCVGLDEVARHAGVGVGTAYRRFRDKDELIDALFDEHLERLVALAERSLGAADAWTGLETFLEGAVEVHVANRGLKELVFSDAHRYARAAEARRRIVPLVDRLVRRAQDAGQVRADLAPTDLGILQFMLSGVQDVAGTVEPDLWRRYLGILLDGLRAPEPTELAPAALTSEQFDRALGGAR
jgi:AcrR family transcriptional regulator